MITLSISDTKKISPNTVDDYDEDGDNIEDLIAIEDMDFDQSICNCFWDIQENMQYIHTIGQKLTITSFNNFIGRLKRNPVKIEIENKEE